MYSRPAHSSFGAIGLAPGPLGGSFQQALHSVPGFSKYHAIQTPYFWTLIIPLHSARQPGVFSHIIFGLLYISLFISFLFSVCPLFHAFTVRLSHARAVHTLMTSPSGSVSIAVIRVSLVFTISSESFR